MKEVQTGLAPFPRKRSQSAFGASWYQTRNTVLVRPDRCSCGLHRKSEIQRSGRLWALQLLVLQSSAAPGWFIVIFQCGPRLRNRACSRKRKRRDRRAQTPSPSQRNPQRKRWPFVFRLSSASVASRQRSPSIRYCHWRPVPLRFGPPFHPVRSSADRHGLPVRRRGS